MKRANALFAYDKYDQIKGDKFDLQSLRYNFNPKPPADWKKHFSPIHYKNTWPNLIAIPKDTKTTLGK